MSAWTAMWWSIGAASAAWVLGEILASLNAGEQSKRQYERLRAAGGCAGLSAFCWAIAGICFLVAVLK